MTIQAFPLTWPSAWPRTQRPERARFSTRFASARDSLMHELMLMGAQDIVISTNVPLRRDGLPYSSFSNPNDVGVAVYFTRQGQETCIPCDRWTRVEDNLQAVRKAVEALRGLERWGAEAIVDAAFRGFEALPSGVPVANWCDVLGVQPDASSAEIDRAYREAVKRHHPDRGGDSDQFLIIQEAYQQAKGLATT